jgi:hypothetical protein
MGIRGCGVGTEIGVLSQGRKPRSRPQTKIRVLSLLFSSNSVLLCYISECIFYFIINKKIRSLGPHNLFRGNCTLQKER